MAARYLYWVFALCAGCSSGSAAEPAPACDVCRPASYTCGSPQMESADLVIDTQTSGGCTAHIELTGQTQHGPYTLSCDPAQICIAGHCDAIAATAQGFAWGSVTCGAH